MKALIIDDDFALSDVIAFTLRRSGFETVAAYDGISGLERWAAEDPDLVILDLNLPGRDGMSICRTIRQAGDTPIIILSVRDDEEDIVSGLRLGADDYMVKPFSPRQMMARIEAVLRRAQAEPLAPGPIVAGDLTLDVSRFELRRDGTLLATVTRLECRLLELLMSNCGQALSAEFLIDRVWGPEGADRTMLKQLVYRLRRKIEADPASPVYLETVANAGYAFAPAGRAGHQEQAGRSHQADW
jgi:DNA-binding response OmpR family regulator